MVAMRRSSDRTLLIAALALMIFSLVGVLIMSISPTSLDNSRRSTDNLSGFESEGQMIFMTGFSREGRIGFTNGPVWLSRHGGGCAACHGLDGRGGFTPMMGRYQAPPITFKALTEEEEFDDKTLRVAITKGLEPSGERLSWPMPRWSMSEREFAALVKYLKELDE